MSPFKSKPKTKFSLPKKPRIPSKNEIIREIQRAEIIFLKSKIKISNTEIQLGIEQIIGKEKYNNLMKILATKKPTKKTPFIVF